MTESKEKTVDVQTSDVTSVSKEERMWAVFCHLSGLAYIVLFWIPASNVLGPLIIWLLKKDTMPLVNEEGKVVLNFQISMLIYAVCAALLSFVVIGILMLPLIVLFNFVMTIIAVVKVSNGEKFKYPLSIQIIR